MTKKHMINATKRFGAVRLLPSSPSLRRNSLSSSCRLGFLSCLLLWCLVVLRRCPPTRLALTTLSPFWRRCGVGSLPGPLRGEKINPSNGKYFRSFSACFRILVLLLLAALLLPFGSFRLCWPPLQDLLLDQSFQLQLIL